MNQEIWRAIKGYKGLYEISNIGRVKSLKRCVSHPKGGLRVIKERILKLGSDTKGYSIIDLSIEGSRKTTTVHRL